LFFCHLIIVNAFPTTITIILFASSLAIADAEVAIQVVPQTADLGIPH